MKKFKSILLTGLSMVLVAALSIAGTVAYLQDDDSAVNVMTLGNVSIEQIEQERDANGKLVPFTQAKPAYPAVYDGTSIPYADPADYPVPNDEAWKVVEDNANVVDKFVTVKNTGKTAAFVRTIIAFEVGKDAVNDPYMHLVCNSNSEVSCVWATENGEKFVIEIKGAYYKICVFTYTDALAPGKTTIPSVKQIYLDKTATNEVCAAYGEAFEILVLSQAIQAAGFADAQTALNAGFGEVNAANAAEWFNGTKATVLVSTVDEANAAMANSADVILIDCNAPAEDVVIPDGYTGTLTIENSKVNSIKANGTANIVIKGDVVVESANGSAITAKVINISGNGNLTAIAADQVGAFGIGGMNTEKITINGVTIKNVVGGFDGEVGTDTKYYKNAPEGGSAIGSGFNGAEIVLNNVHIEKAIGGSKAAGIGARHHVGVNVTIIDSTIDYVEGGATAAAIGGSRVSNGGNEDGTTINITNSTITAKGGVYGAGIGSGYDTHCSAKQPLCTINITGSTINATGGQYAAGVGTGYHNAALAGVIKDSVINAVSGEKFYKATYTQAQDIGFGVVDPAREGTQTNSKLVCNGATIGIPAV